MTTQSRSTNNRQFPDKLPDPPRPVCLRPGREGRSGHLVVFLILAAAGIFFLLIGLEAVAWRLFGTTVPGGITAKSTFTRWSGGRGQRTLHTVYEINVTYRVSDQPRTCRWRVDETTYHRLKEGDPLRVWIIPHWASASPQVQEPGVEPTLGVWFNEGVSWLLVALVWYGSIAMTFWASFLWPRILRGLVERGTPTTGWITKVEMLRGRRASYRIDFRYQTPKCSSAEGGTAAVAFWEHHAYMHVEVGHYDQAQAGQAVTVLYDPYKPHRSVLYRYAEYQVVGLEQPATVPGTSTKLVVDSAPMTDAAGYWQGNEVELTRPSADRMVLGPKRAYAWFLIFLILFPAAFAFANYPMAIFFGCFFAFLAVYVVGVYLVVSRWTFCRKTGRLICTRLWIRREFDLSQILAIQVCFGGTHHRGGGKGGPREPFDTFQMNLVLDDPRGSRLNLTQHADLVWLLQAGEQLADFLDVPLMDKHLTRP